MSTTKDRFPTLLLATDMASACAVQSFRVLAHNFFLNHVRNTTHDIPNERSQLASSKVISLAARASFAMLQEITHALVWSGARMAEEQIPTRIMGDRRIAVKLGSQVVDVVHIDIRWAGSRLHVIE